MRNNYLTLDIETTPRQDREPNPDDVTPPANYKNHDTIRAYQESKAEEVYRKLALDPIEAQVIVIGVAYGGDKPISLYSDNEEKLFLLFEEYLSNLQINIFDNKDLLKKNPDIWTIVGFNLTFDIGMIYLRSKKYGNKLIQQLLRDLHPYSDRLADVMRMAFPVERNKYVSLDTLCQFFGLKGKGDINGSMVYDMYKEGRIEEIRTYCESDVDKTRQLYNILK